MDEDVSSSDEHGRHRGAARPVEETGVGAVPLVPSPRDRARYRPLRDLEELLDDVLRGAG